MTSVRARTGAGKHIGRAFQDTANAEGSGTAVSDLL